MYELKDKQKIRVETSKFIITFMSANNELVAIRKKKKDIRGRELFL